MTPFQDRVQPWMLTCFGAEISADVAERNHRFLEEALELVQSTGCTASEAHQLVDYVFGREIGETHQEIGGVMVTLAALCLALGEDMHAAGETELARIWTKVEKIRAKQAAKPKHSPLPQHVAAHPAPATVESVETLKARLGSYAITEEYDFPGDAEEFCGYWCHECREHVEADGTGHGKDCPCYGVAPNTPRAVKERAALAPPTAGSV
jgi:hypothetical protein